MFQSTLEATMNSVEVPELKSTQDIDKYADFIVSTAVDRGIQTTKSEPLRVNQFWKKQLF